MTKEEKAKDLFAKGYNCCQAVVGAFCEEAGLESGVAFRLANGFGGGVRCGELCGALSGAVIAVGLKCGFHVEGDFEQKAYCNQKTVELVDKFKEANGSALCRDLLGADIRCAADHSSPAVKEAHKTVCPRVVASAARILDSMEF